MTTRDKVEAILMAFMLIVIGFGLTSFLGLVVAATIGITFWQGFLSCLLLCTALTLATMYFSHNKEIK